MSFDNGAGKIKSQPGAFRLFDGFSRTIKPVEDVWQIPGFDARSLIANTNNNLLRPHLTTDFDLTFRRVLECIGNEIDDHLIDARFVSKNDREVLREIRNNSVLGGLCTEFFCDPSGNDWQRDIA